MLHPLKKILVIQTASIGDVILATPVIEKLHNFYPDAAIDILLKKGTEELFHMHPYLHETIVWDKSRHKYGHFFRLLVKIRNNRYDLVINIQRFASTGIMTAVSGASLKIGFKKNPLSFLYDQRVDHMIREGVHEVDRNLKLIEGLTDASFIKPKLYLSASDNAKTAQFKMSGYITFSPGSLWFTKQYPKEKWIEFANHLPTATRVYFLGSKHDKELCDEIIHQSGNKNSLNLAGKLGFLESASLMKDAGMNFTNDSAPLHLASAVNAPVTVIYCSTVPSFGFGPLSDDAHIVESNESLSCRPCGLHGKSSCPEKHFRCATTIRVELLTGNLRSHS